MGAANNLALEIAGITRDAPNPPGGVIIKDESGALTGVLEENAHIGAWLSILQKVDSTGLKAIVRAGSELWARYGYTTGQEGRSQPAQVELLREVANEDGFAIDVVTYADVLIAGADFFTANVDPDFVYRFRIAGAKLTIDGSPQGFAALRDRPYLDPVGNYPTGYAGFASATMEQVTTAIDRRSRTARKSPPMPMAKGPLTCFWRRLLPQLSNTGPMRIVVPH